MKNNHRSLLVLLFFCGMIACTSKPTLENFDTDRWKADRGGCRGERALMLPALEANLAKFKGASSNHIGELLGRPDAQALAARNQEYYIYYLEKGPQCDKLASQARTVAFRFSAIGLATEITFQQGQPF
jgi:hypothetical protein